MLSRLDLDLALTGNVDIARDMRDIAQEKMALMKLQIQVLQNQTADERLAASSASTPSGPLKKANTMPNLTSVGDDDEDTEATEVGQTDSAHDQPTQGPSTGAGAEPAQNLPGVPTDAG